MSRIWCVLIVAAACAGCRNSPPVMDPFFGAQTVPPPGTAVPAPNAPPAPPYYSSAPTSTIGSPLVTPPAGTQAPNAAPASPPPTSPPPPIPYSVPPGFSPAPAGYGRMTPNVSSPGGSLAQSAANAQPLVAVPPAANRPVYALPGGFSYPQATSTAAPPTLAHQNVPGLLNPRATAGATDIRSAAPGTPTAARQAGWQAADEKNASSSAAIAGESAAAVSPTSGSTVRIVEPAPAATASSAAMPNRSADQFRPGNTTTLTMPAGSVSNGTLNQSLAGEPIRDLADFPPVQTASFAVPAAGNAPVAAAATTSNNYGYRSDYGWVKGKLEYTQSARTWRLRYIPPEAANDHYGGSVILSDPSNRLAGFQPGQFVVAYGTLDPAGRDTGSFAAMYNIQRIERQ
ncbi:MAG: hypothetical protein IT427_07115 [Pirellulales bacterium]|nr:hypothetical protein [Pirellulales bacterium]